MTINEQREIDRLLSAIADGESVEERVLELQELLRHRVDLQRYYQKVMALHTLLEFELSLSKMPFQPLMPPGATALEQPMIAEANPALSRVASRVGLQSWPSSRFLLAASVAIAGMAGFLVLAGSLLWKSPTGTPVALDTPSAATDSTVSVPLGDRILVRNGQLLDRIALDTRTSRVSHLFLPVANGGSGPSVTLCGGTAWMEEPSGNMGRGHLVELPPGHSLDVYVEAQSAVQNMVVMLEIDANGNVASRMSFNNWIDKRTRRMWKRAGPLGNWSQINNTDKTKFFLFTGSHKLEASETDDSWYLSDFCIGIDSPSVVHIGFDDSGYAAQVSDNQSDRDYDDITATLRIEPIGAAVPKNPIRVIGGLDEPEAAELLGVGYPIEVNPGETMLLRTAKRSQWASSLELVDRDTGQVVWRLSAEDESVKPTPLNWGVVAVVNDSDEPRSYEVIGRFQAPYLRDLPSLWNLSRCRLLGNFSDSLWIGFEDSDGLDVDWDDIEVYVQFLK
ncbi:hypothetical protein [Aeoliella sp. SH292]|uniref:hypothetical protein n=1 Tax=Aeoliella sp. SH292 TaxID=3454464 RepID=UPI003F96DEB3